MAMKLPARGLAMLSTLVFPALLCAEQVPAVQAGKPAEGLSVSFGTGVAHQFETDIDNGGDFSMTRVGFAVALRYPIGEALRLTHPLVYDYDHYDFSANGFGEPWDDTHTLSYAPNLDWRIDEKWSASVGGIIGFAAESDADLDQALIGGGQIGARYRFNENLTLGLGVLAITQIEDNVQVIPVLLFDWQITEQLALRNVRPMAGLRSGAGAELAWQFAEPFTLAVAVNYDSRRFRLDDDVANPSGVGENQRIPVYVEFNYKPNPMISLSIIGGASFAGELRVENSIGNEITEQDYDPAPFVGVGGSIRF